MNMFGDIGKATNDLLGGGFNYDHKLSIGNKTDSGLVRAPRLQTPTAPRPPPAADGLNPRGPASRSRAPIRR